jgi:uncharacterized small protein (DUF1192 family)
MSCWHGWHGCGPWCGSPPPSEYWYGPADWYDEGDRPVRRRYRRGRAPELASAASAASAADALEERLAELQDEIRRAQAELAALRGAKDAADEP